MRALPAPPTAEGRSDVPSLIRRSTTLLTGEVAARALGVLLYAALARILGVKGFGAVSFAMTVGLVAGVAIDFGQTAHSVRVVGREPDWALGVLGAVWRGKIALTCLVAAVAGVGFAVAGFSPLDVTLVVLLSVWAGFVSVFESERATARALGAIRVDSAANAVESLLRLCLVVSAAAVGGIVAAGLGFAAEAILAAIALLLVIRWTGIVGPDGRATKEKSLTFLWSAAPAGAGAVVIAIF